jgi:hypothetical protein
MPFSIIFALNTEGIKPVSTYLCPKYLLATGISIFISCASTKRGEDLERDINTYAGATILTLIPSFHTLLLRHFIKPLTPTFETGY